MKEYKTKGYIPREKQDKICVTCGKEYKGHGLSKYCSHECNLKAYRAEEDKRRNRKIPLAELQARIDKKTDTFEVIANESKYVTLKCRDCGEEKLIHIKNTYKDYTPRCKNCSSIKRKAHAEQKILLKIKFEEEQARLREQKENERKLKFTKRCRECGVEFYDPKRKSYCSERCQRKATNRQKDHVRRQRIGNEYDYITLNELAIRDKDICHICKGKVDWNDFTDKEVFIAGGNYPSIDHLKPLSKGGVHKWWNVKLAHCRCNSVKNCNEVYEECNGQLRLAL